MTALTLLFLQSCTSLRTHIDKTCATQFVDQYTQVKDALFVLPWKVGESYQLTQGNCTLESHNIDQNQHMSYDFKMPLGTQIHAMANGRIAVVVENNRDHIDDAYNQANFIGIEHEGGIVSWYMHLKNNGVTVAVNDQVLQGDLIGYSGNTGSSAYPHLHIYAQQLTDACRDAKNKTANPALCPSIPMSFVNASPNDTTLKEWQTYTALSY